MVPGTTRKGNTTAARTRRCLNRAASTLRLATARWEHNGHRLENTAYFELYLYNIRFPAGVFFAILLLPNMRRKNRRFELLLHA